MAAFSSIAIRTLSVLVLSGALVCGLSAKPKSSLSDLDLESAEARLTLEKVLDENDRLKLEIVKLNEKLAISDATAKRLTESVAVANGEAEVFRRQIGEKNLKLEALGIGGVTGSESKLEQRLLKAVSDLRLGDEQRKKLTEALLGLTEASMNFAKVSATNQPDSRLALEVQIRRASDFLGT